MVYLPVKLHTILIFFFATNFALRANVPTLFPEIPCEDAIAKHIDIVSR